MAGTRGRSDRGGQLELAMVEDGMDPLRIGSSWAICDEKAYLDCRIRANRRRYGVWKRCLAESTRPWDFRRSRRSSGLLLIPRSVSWRPAIRAADRLPMPLAQNCCAKGYSYLRWQTAMGEACESLGPFEMNGFGRTFSAKTLFHLAMLGSILALHRWPLVGSDLARQSQRTWRWLQI